MEIKIVENISPEQYNLAAHHPMQSWQWGEARKKMHVEVVRITDGENVFQMTLHRIPYTSYKVGYLPKSVIPTPAVLDFLYKYCISQKIIFVKIEPDVYKNENKSILINTNKSQQYEIKKSPHPLFPDWTIVLDLKPSEEDLLKSMKPKTRYNIKLAQKKGVTVVEESTDTGFNTFANLYFDTCKRQKYHGHTHAYHKIIWETLQNNISHILIAKYENTPLAAYELFYFKNKFYYPYGGTSVLHRNLMPANLIMWEAIRLGKKLGAQTFDMWGALPPGYADNHPWAGFTRFKEGYGGIHKQFIGSFDLIINSQKYKLYNLMYKARNLFLTAL